MAKFAFHSGGGLDKRGNFNKKSRFKDGPNSGHMLVHDDTDEAYGPFPSERHAEMYAAEIGMHRKNYRVVNHVGVQVKPGVNIRADKPIGKSVRGSDWDD